MEFGSGSDVDDDENADEDVNSQITRSLNFLPWLRSSHSNSGEDLVSVLPHIKKSLIGVVVQLYFLFQSSSWITQMMEMMISSSWPK